MTYEEAMSEAKAGKKVTHEYFTSEEYFCCQAVRIVCEQGFSMSDWYTGEDWQKKDWRLYD